MPMTEKLYETNGMISTFRARVLSCEKRADGYAVILDRTAFFPEGGGQSADTGCLSNAQVRDVQIENGEILHFTDLSVSGEITGTLHFDTRFRKMQNHLGEHLLCGAIHRLFGFDNVGFHLGADDMTFDINGILTESQIAEAEKEANRAIWEDAPVRCYTPSPEDLSRLDYRAKAEKIVMLSSCYYGYRRRNNSIMAQKYSLKNLDLLEARERRLKFIKEKFPALFSLDCCRLRFECVRACQLSLKYLDKDDREKSKKIMKGIVQKNPLTYREYKNLPIGKKVWCFLSNISFTGTCYLRNWLHFGP